MLFFSSIFSHLFCRLLFGLELSISLSMEHMPQTTLSNCPALPPPFLSRSAVLERDLAIGGVSVCVFARLFVRLPNANIDSKPNTVGSCGFHLLVAQGLWFSDTNFGVVLPRETRL